MNQMLSSDLIIVIPCYNEEKRLKNNAFKSFLKTANNVKIIFCNDGSTDNTLQVLQDIKNQSNLQVIIHNMKKNGGKAQAVREGVLFAYANNLKFNKIAYLDADLSTSLSECHLLSNKIKESVVFCFGSRILKIDTHIERKPFRFFIGRIIATVISKQLGLSVYDSQCGCKIFSNEIALQLFKEEFISKWLFDVEIFHRLIKIFGKNNIKNNTLEIPLKSWIDTDNSKVKISYFFRLWYDLFLIRKKYLKTK